MYFWLGFKTLEYLLGYCLLVMYRKSQENIHKISILHFRNVYRKGEGLEMALLWNRLCNEVWEADSDVKGVKYLAYSTNYTVALYS